MTFDEMVEHYGSQTKAAEALSVPRQTVNKWKAGIPFDTQYRIQTLSCGALVADRQRKVSA